MAHHSFNIILSSRDTDIGSSANFSVDLERSGIPFSESEISVGVDYVIFPNLIYPIRSGRNSVVFDEGAGNLTATITEGYYDSTTFPAALKTALEAVGSDTYTVSISSSTNKITIASTGTFSIKFSLSSNELWKILGFPYLTDTSTAASHTGTMTVRLDGDEYVNLFIENLDSPTVSSSFNYRGLIDMIPLNVDFGSIVYYQGNQMTNYVLGRMSDLKQLRIRMTDIDGYDLPLYDNAEVIIKLRVESAHIFKN